MENDQSSTKTLLQGLQRRVIRRWNGNLVHFLEIILKNCENVSYEAEFAFFWQVVGLANEPISWYW